MKKLILAALATCTLALTLNNYTFAHENNEGKPNDYHQNQHQDGWNKSEHKHHQKYLKRMAKALDLTEQQIEDIKAIYEQARFSEPKPNREINLWLLDPEAENYSDKVIELAKQRAIEIEHAIIKRGELRAATYKILTPEQRQKAAELRLKHQNKLTPKSL